MFGLLFDLWTWLWKKSERRILIIGIDNVGKTETLESLKRIYLKKMLISERQPTVGLNLARIPISSNVEATVWDVGGQSLLRSLWKAYYKESDAILYVIDATDRERLNESLTCLHELVIDDVWLSVKRSIPILVMANKSELEGLAMTIGEIQSAVEEFSEDKPLLIRDKIHILKESVNQVSDNITQAKKPYIETVWPTSAKQDIGIQVSIARLANLWRMGVCDLPPETIDEAPVEVQDL